MNISPQISLKKLFCIGFFSLSAVHLQAEELTYTRTVAVEDLNGQTHLMEQVVQKNLDGSLTILPDSISPELKYIREQQCASLGGVDVTNDSNMSITPEVINVTVCDITGTKAATHVAQMKNAVSAMVIDSEFDTQGEVTPSYLAAPG